MSGGLKADTEVNTVLGTVSKPREIPDDSPAEHCLSGDSDGFFGFSCISITEKTEPLLGKSSNLPRERTMFREGMDESSGDPFLVGTVHFSRKGSPKAFTVLSKRTLGSEIPKSLRFLPDHEGNKGGPSLVDESVQDQQRSIPSRSEKPSDSVVFPTPQKKAGEFSAVFNFAHRTQVNSIAGKAVQDTTDLLRELQPLARGNKERRVRADRLKTEFEATATRFSEVQKKMMVTMRTARLPADMVAVEQDASASSEELIRREQMLQSKKKEIQDLEFETAMQLEREQRVHQLESDIIDINEIMRDLSAMVHTQGEMVDSIEQNVENCTWSSVEEGVKNL
ncbi:t-SNARE domain-containing protein 1-like [Macrobrachium nipponense]|uniref:t-SNARE domain-containing protein 1-like n=1 Tax=Macrobrachium nipponense TaxID=159736 RepID=UPI0030C7DD3E